MMFLPLVLDYCLTVTPSVRLFYTVRLLILAVIPPLYDLKVLYNYSVLESIFLISAATTQIFNSIEQLVIPIRIPSKEAKAEI